MIIKKQRNIKPEQVTSYNSTGTKIQWLLNKDDGAPRFAMRRFEIQAKGNIGLHQHPEEHEIYVLAGTGEVFNDKGEKFTATQDDIIYVPPDEPHGYKNLSANESFVFLCIIPILKKDK